MESISLIDTQTGSRTGVVGEMGILRQLRYDGLESDLCHSSAQSSPRYRLMIAAFLGECIASHSGARLMGGKDLSIAVRLDDFPWNRIVADEVLVRVTGDDRHCGNVGGAALINQ